MTSALNDCKTKSSPGLDHVRYTHLKLLSQSNLSPFLKLFNDILKSSKIPNDWNKFEIVPILKKSCDPNNSSSYRPIAKGSTIRKLFERIIKNRLEWRLEAANKLCRFQVGFRRGKSTMDNLLVLWSAVKLAFRSNK